MISTVRSGQGAQGGSITVLHTHGRNGQYHPHLHLLATSGGYDAQGARWEHLQYLPYELLRRKWQWHLLRMVRQTLKTEAINQLVDICFRKYPNGLVTNVQKGQVPSQYQSLARYVAKYVVSPPISVRRIDRYDGERVTYHYRSHRTERLEHETVTVETFIGRMVQHTVPRVQAHPLLRSTGDQDVCQGEGGDSSGSGEGGGRGQGCGADHRPLNLSAAVRAKYGTGPVGLSALSE